MIQEDQLENSGQIDDSTNNKIFRAIAEVFQNAQSTYAGHRRHVAVLKKIQSKAISQGYGEVFSYFFNKLVTKILPLKKSEIIGDRIVRLVAAFIASNEKDIENQRQSGEVNTELEDIFSSFIDQFIRHILRGIESKDKNVRYRVTQLIAVIMDNMGEIAEDLYNLMMWSLNKRIYDKEPNVRIQAIFCLTKFQDDENAGDNIDDATQRLLSSIQNDPSAEVRRAAMLNLVNNKMTRNHILGRARDINVVNRRLVYSRILKTMGPQTFVQLETQVINQLLKWGLEDREDSVRQACSKLISYDWLNMVDGDIIELLEKLDVTKSEISEKAMEALFQYRRDVISKIKFPQEVWNDFTVETVFLLKCFYNHCIANELLEIIDENFLEAAKLADVIQRYIDQRFTDESISDSDKSHLNFVIQQLLEIAYKYDFSDEIGRRAMLNVIRNALAKYRLSEPLVKISLKVLKVLSINERDFITMTVEIITDIRDDDIEKQELEEELEKSKANDESDDDNDAIESFHSAVENLVHGDGNTESESNTPKIPPEEKQARPEVLLVCLTMSRYMLELVNTSLEQNIMISSLIDTLITPAVRNTQPEIRELGVRNLGLCCLLDVQLATENMYILGMCVSKGNASLKDIALQVIVDIFSVHGTKVVDGEGKVDSISLHKIFYKILKNQELPQCQAIAAEGLCKLFLGDVFIDDDLFETLVLSYFSPANTKNEALVQAFAFCLPVYCFSHIHHQQRMSRVAADVLLRLSMLWDDLQSNEEEDTSLNTMLKPSVIFQQLIHWTDPTRLVHQTEKSFSQNDVQIDFLLSVLKLYYRFERKDVKKMILTNINRFVVAIENDNSKLREISEFVEDILENDSIDNVSKNSLNKFLITLREVISEKEQNETNQTKNDSSDSDDQYSMILESTGDVTAESAIACSKETGSESTSSVLSQIQDAPMLPGDLTSSHDNSNSVSSLLEEVESPASGEARAIRNRKRKRVDEIEEISTSSAVEKPNKNVSFILPEDSERDDGQTASDESYHET